MATYNSVLTLIQTLLQTNSDITAFEHRQVEESILAFARDQWLPGDIKEIDCTNAYITANFDTNGVGIVGGEREGWAICNGYNGWTRNRTGRVSVGYGTNTPLSGAPQFPSVGTSLTTPVIGGSKDAAIIDHTHEYQDAMYSEQGGHKPTGNMGGSGDTDGDNGFYYRTRNGAQMSTPPPMGQRPLTDNPQSSTGSGNDKNMQPYIVTLFIQKL